MVHSNKELKLFVLQLENDKLHSTIGTANFKRRSDQIKKDVLSIKSLQSSCCKNTTCKIVSEQAKGARSIQILNLYSKQTHKKNLRENLCITNLLVSFDSSCIPNR